MANSPGPSTSTSADTRQPAEVKVKDSSGPDSGPSKTRRAKRKPRSKSKKDPQEPSKTVFYNSSTQPYVENPSVSCDIDFKIESADTKIAAKSIVYRQRNKSAGHIKIGSFVKNGAPCVFRSKYYNDYEEKFKILGKIASLSINGLKQPSATVSQKVAQAAQDGNKSKKKTKDKKERKKEDSFPDYISKEAVVDGLKSGQLMKGFIRINPKNFKEAYVGNEDTTKSDYIISSVLDRNRAMEGDEVILRLKAVTDEKKTMEVVYITKKVHPGSSVGFLNTIDKDKSFALFTPRDRRVPQMKIPKINWPNYFHTNPELYKNILFVAQLSDWTEVRYASGTITEILGLNGDLRVESLAILREFLLDPTPYGDDVKDFLPKSQVIPEEELKYREDIRDECVFTIDPLTARDLDDAVSCKELPNGNLEVGVHISDASFYLAENTKLDEQVRKKATTIYMVDSVYHMLPTELCLFCSLLPGKDKLSFSVFWEFSETAEGDFTIINKRITRTVMNSCSQLAYEHAQMMIDEPDREFLDDDLPPICNGFTYKDLSKVVNNLQRVAVKLREKRADNGALKIDQVKLSYSLNPATGKPEKFWIYENKPAHRLIEEFMLLANGTVAQWIYDAYPDLAFLRLHEPPKPSMINELQQSLESIGIHIDISSSGGIQTSLNKYYSPDFLGQSRMAVLNHLFAKPMKRARYFCSGALPDDEDVDFRHFALSIPIYTHFTSPIRRYADIMVHRLLAASLNYTEAPQWIPEEVAEIAEICNRQKYHAKKAGDASSDLYLAHYIEENQPFVEEAVVVDAKDRSVDVLVLKTGSIVRIYTNNFGERVNWKSEEIPSNDSGQCKNSSGKDNTKKMWRIIVNYPKTQTEESCLIVLEIFTLIRVELTRKPKSNKLEAKLLRPV